MSNGPQSSHKESWVDSLLQRLGHPTVHILLIALSFLMLMGLGIVLVIGTWIMEQQASVPTLTPHVASSARISVNPTGGQPGALLRVAGQNWRPSDVVFVSLEAPFAPADPSFAYAGAVADQNGQFEVGFTLPQEERWQHSGVIKVVAWAERSGDKAVTLFQVLSPGTVTPVLAANNAIPTLTVGLSPASTKPQNPPQPQAAKAATAAPANLSAPPSPVPLSTEGWYGQYFANSTLSGSPAFLRSDPEIRFDWANGSPGNRVGPDNFSVRWTRSVAFPGGVYRFFAQADDGVRVWVDDKLLIDQWHEASSTTYVADTYLWEGPHLLRVEYYDHTGRASVHVWWERQEIFPDWKAEYFNNRELTGQPVAVRNDPQLRFNWAGEAPAPGVNADDFSARWTRRVRFPPGTYRFYTRADGGIRVWLDSSLMIDFWQNPTSGLRTTDLSLGEGEYGVRVEYAHGSADGRAELRWELLPPMPTGTIPPALPATRRPTIPASAALLIAPTASPTPRPITVKALAVQPVSTTTKAVSTATEAPGVTIMMAPAHKPTVTLLSAESLPGSPVVVRGRGWPAGQGVVIYLHAPGEELPALNSLKDEAARTKADENGALEVSLNLPEKWQGLPQVGLVAYTADGLLGAQATLNVPQVIPAVSPPEAASTPSAEPQLLVAVRPSLRVQPAEVALGAQAVVSGEGWKPGDEIMISLVEPGGDLGEASPFARALADERGMFSTTIALPEDPRWAAYTELIVLAHSIDWTTRGVTPLRLARPTPTYTLSPPTVSTQTTTP